jgi:hypothetical protein
MLVPNLHEVWQVYQNQQTSCLPADKFAPSFIAVNYYDDHAVLMHLMAHRVADADYLIKHSRIISLIFACPRQVGRQKFSRCRYSRQWKDRGVVRNCLR